jgi:catechol 2,3-dioxygenase-like lactoylglutathione lyase family enzyme/predicted enzyme related to lactoylglutathione lyase
MTTTRFLRFEGGHIGVTGDRQAAVDWYCRHLGMTVAWDQPAEGQTLLRFPGSQAIPLVSVGGGESDNVWGDATHAVRESPVRLCLACPNLEATHAALTADGVRVTWIVIDELTGNSFDFYDLEGTRLTAVATPSEATDARFTGYASPRIGVSDLNASVDWYSHNVGMAASNDEPSDHRALMTMGDYLPIWLEEKSADSFSGRTDAYARPYFLTLDIDEAHAWAAEQGFDPSPISGEKLRVFHFWDPDGNAINIWTYPCALLDLASYDR